MLLTVKQAIVKQEQMTLAVMKQGILAVIEQGILTRLPLTGLALRLALRV